MSVYFSFRQWRVSVRSAVSQLLRGHRKLRPLFWEPARGNSLLLLQINEYNQARIWMNAIKAVKIFFSRWSKMHNTFCIMIESMMHESPARPIYAVGDSKNTGLPMRPLQQVRSFWAVVVFASVPVAKTTQSLCLVTIACMHKQPAIHLQIESHWREQCSGIVILTPWSRHTLTKDDSWYCSNLPCFSLLLNLVLNSSSD